MAYVTIPIAPEHADRLASELLHRYAALARELYAAADRHADARDGLDALVGLQVELRDVEDALEQLEWGSRERLEAVELTAHPEVLADAVTAALAEAAQALARDRCAAHGDPEAGPAALRAVAGFLDLAATVLGVDPR